MRLEIIYERLPVAFHPSVLPLNSTAEFIYNFALTMGQRGWTVVVYVHDTCQQPFQKDNVLFIDRTLYDNDNTRKNRDRVLCINCQPSMFEQQAKYYILVDPFIPTASVQFDEAKFENLILLSKNQLNALVNVSQRKIKVIERVSDEKVIGNVTLKDKANIVLYTGPHDSNLIKLLSIWWKVNKHTDYELVVTGDPSPIHAIDVTGVTYHHTKTIIELNQFFRQSKFWFNYEGNDVSASTNIHKAISADTIPLYEKGCQREDILRQTETGLCVENDLEKNLIEILNGHKVLYRHFEKAKSEYSTKFDRMIDVFEDMFNAKNKTKNLS